MANASQHPEVKPGNGFVSEEQRRLPIRSMPSGNAKNRRSICSAKTSCRREPQPGTPLRAGGRSGPDRIADRVNRVNPQQSKRQGLFARRPIPPWKRAANWPAARASVSHARCSHAEAGLPPKR